MSRQQPFLGPPKQASARTEAEPSDKVMALEQFQSGRNGLADKTARINMRLERADFFSQSDSALVASG